jgi:hypothetical protein
MLLGLGLGTRGPLGDRERSRSRGAELMLLCGRILCREVRLFEGA